VESTAPASYFKDERVSATLDPTWAVSQTGWGVCPDGLRELLMLLRRRYGPIPTLITENGIALQEVRLAHNYLSHHQTSCASRRGRCHF
jgi:beta-glucosidase/6-phospho-beta-glucosidase/beta-galactosidase